MTRLGSPDSQRGPEALAETMPTVESGAPAAPESGSLPRGAQVGRFLVLAPIGAGAMGIVVAAHDPALDRKVALKLLRPGVFTGEAATEGKQRLLREAQAMAKLSHPNVVTVYEVGTVDDHVFVAMEYVEGKTFTRWLAERPRGWWTIVSTLVQAGRGVAAAHARGIVHRDFKPDNVLIADRARVSDFGLASTVATRRAAPGDDTVPPPGTPLSMTRAGQLIGTPAYMSPEQHQGLPADARADQFSFCVTLYEALHGERPFEGETYREYAENVIAGRIRAAPRGARVPARIRAALLRGLAADPAARWPSMDALLAELDRDPTAARRKIAFAGAIAALAALAVVAWVSRDRAKAPRLCRDAPASVARAWSPAAADGIRAAFDASGRATARDTFARARGALDDYARRLVAMRTEACEATHVRGEQSPQLLDLRMRCLDRRTGELGALASLLASGPDPALVDNAVEAALSLGRIEACADAVALTSAVPPPDDPALRARVDALRELVTRVEAMARGGKYGEALAIAGVTVVAAEQTGFAPIVAETLAQRALIESRLGKLKLAEATWHRVAGAAASARDDALLARAWIYLVHNLGFGQARGQEAAALEPVATAAVTRAGDPAALRAELYNSVGGFRYASGRYAAAAELFESVARERTLAVGGDHPSVAVALGNLGIALDSMGEYARALEVQQRALAIRERTLGPDHAMCASSHHSIGVIYSALDRNEESLASFHRALAIREQTLAPDSPQLVDTMNSIGLVLRDLARPAEAREWLERALELRERIYGPDHPNVASSLTNLANLLHGGGDRREARRLAERALEIREKALGREHPEVAASLNTLGLIVRKLGEIDLARGYLRRALEIREKALGREHPDVGSTLNNLGLLEQEERRWVESDRFYRRALPIFEHAYGKAHPRTLEGMLFWAKTKVGLGDRPAAIALLEEALAGYTSRARADEAETIASVRAELARLRAR